jgi:hypothetical protein
MALYFTISGQTTFLRPTYFSTDIIRQQLGIILFDE